MIIKSNVWFNVPEGKSPEAQKVWLQRVTTEIIRMVLKRGPNLLETQKTIITAILKSFKEQSIQVIDQDEVLEIMRTNSKKK